MTSTPSIPVDNQKGGIQTAACTRRPPVPERSVNKSLATQNLISDSSMKTDTSTLFYPDASEGEFQLLPETNVQRPLKADAGMLAANFPNEASMEFKRGNWSIQLRALLVKSDFWLKVYVSDQISGRPVTRLTLQLYEDKGGLFAQEQTDHKGRAIFAALPIGDFTITLVE